MLTLARFVRRSPQKEGRDKGDERGREIKSDEFIGSVKQLLSLLRKHGCKESVWESVWQELDRMGFEGESGKGEAARRAMDQIDYS